MKCACDTCMDFFPIDWLYQGCPVCGNELKVAYGSDGEEVIE